ncbi:MAG: type II toxin-antitoxin system HicA family toxin [Methylococcaceae bacterium]|nr:MAG: type II toxin-antitoxin system HicA family toxin [Methylococcaceae bacterium]
MSGEYPPLTYKDIKMILAYLGFVARPQKGTSHEQWVKEKNGILYKVTVDCPKSPFSQTLIKSMAEQAGMKKRDFYRILKQL